MQVLYEACQGNHALAYGITCMLQGTNEGMCNSIGMLRGCPVLLSFSLKDYLRDSYAADFSVMKPSWMIDPSLHVQGQVRPARVRLLEDHHQRGRRRAG